jgi:hypothetical protein
MPETAQSVRDSFDEVKGHKPALTPNIPPRHKSQKKKHPGILDAFKIYELL